jgi:hypothetical protein
MKKILVNDVLREFLDPKEFFVKRYDENMKEGNTDCFGLRQTGRTTRMIIETIQKVVENPGSKFTILTHNGGMCSRIIRLFNHYKYQMDVEIPFESISVIPEEEFNLIGSRGTTVLRDNGITDVRITKELAFRWLPFL